jgi:hypothetical protein
MSIEWYRPICHFGYTITLPNDDDFREFVNHIHDNLSPFLPESFSIRSILTTYDNRMDIVLNDNGDLDAHAIFVMGFEPDSNLQNMILKSTELRQFIDDHEPLFDGYQFTNQPNFYCGIEWIANNDLNSESEYKSEESEESESEEETEDEESEEELENNTDSEEKHDYNENENYIYHNFNNL